MTVDRRRAPTDDATTADWLATRADAWAGPAPRMRDITHAHRDHDPRAWHWFARGPLVAADGGERPADERADADGRTHDRDIEDEQLRDVSHEPPHGDGANQVWDRGEDEDESA